MYKISRRIRDLKSYATVQCSRAGVCTTNHLLSFFMETLKLGENIPPKLKEKSYKLFIEREL